MKVVLFSIFVAFCITAQASTETDELKAEIAQRERAIEQMKAEGRPTGRFEMTVFRLKRDLERKEDMERLTKMVDNK